MTTQKHPVESEILQPLHVSPTETQRLSFLEGPAIDLVELPLDAMTQEEIEILLNEIKTLSMVPGQFNRDLEIESVTVVLGKAKPPRVKKKTNVDDLF